MFLPKDNTHETIDSKQRQSSIIELRCQFVKQCNFANCFLSGQCLNGLPSVNSIISHGSFAECTQINSLC